MAYNDEITVVIELIPSVAKVLEFGNVLYRKFSFTFAVDKCGGFSDLSGYSGFCGVLQCSGSVWKLFNGFFYFPGNNSIFAPVNLPQSSECWNSVKYLTLPSLGSGELSGDKNLKSGMRMGLHSERFLLDHMSSRECKA